MEKQAKIFKRSKWNDFLFFLPCLGFTIGGYFLLEKEPVMGWLCILFFGFFSIIALLHVFTNSSYLRLDEEGFELKTLLVKRKTKWCYVENFRQVNYRDGGGVTIVYDYTDEYNVLKRGEKRFKLFDKRSGGITSCYTIRTDTLLDLMIAYKRRSKSKFK